MHRTFPRIFTRQASQSQYYAPRNRIQLVQHLWRTSPAFRASCGLGGVGAGAFYVANLETVPVSGRRRFNCISPESEVEQGAQLYQNILQEYRQRILPPSHPSVRQVRKVLSRLIPVSGLENQNWEAHVIADDSQKNAFVIPGGKVFVFSGILGVTKDDDGLATVLSHEIAHGLASHSAERMSQLWIVLAAINVGRLLFGIDLGELNTMVADYAFLRPGSRKQESEADFIGLMMMAQACYNPTAAIDLWRRMQASEQQAGQSVPAWMSTHPSSHSRMEKMQEWMPEALQKAESSNCSTTLEYAKQFKAAFR